MTSAPPRRFRRSRHVSLFKKGEDAFLYHDLVGDILRMDRALLAFIDFFAEEHGEDEARAKFRAQFTERDLDAFFEILPQHHVLVAPGVDEQRALDGWRPVRGPWLLAYEPKDGRLTLGYRDRTTGDAVLETPAEVAARTFALVDGKNTIAGIVDKLGAPNADEVRKAIFRWTHSDRQVLKLIENPVESYDKLPPYVESTMPYERLREAEVLFKDDVASTRSYHKETIANADDQFEVRETTLSHAFRVPHPALKGKTYGGRLAQVLVERGIIAERDKVEVVEVGGGTGFLCNLFLEGLRETSPALYAKVRWTICDLSPALQKSQVARTTAHGERVRFVNADAVALPIKTGSVDFLIANEMIADLETVRIRKDELRRGEGPGLELAQRNGLSLDDAPEPEFWLNAGAFRMIAEVARVLRPGGRAVLTEFGELDRYPIESTHLDHREFSIHFGHVKRAAEARGLEARVEPVPDLLGMDPEVPCLVTNQSFFVVLRAFLAEHGVKLEKIAYTPEMITALAGSAIDLPRIWGIRFQPAGERALGLRPHEFKALVLRKPETAPPKRKKIEL